MIRPAFRLPALTLALALPVGAAMAQTVAFGGLRSDPTQPVNVNADTLTVNQADGTALFTGNVIVVQGDMKMAADQVQVEYAQDQKSIQRLHATGNVILTSPTEAAQGKDGVYTIASGEVVMTGDVLVTQGDSTIAGQKLVVDINTGNGTMSGGRVNSTFIPNQKPAPQKKGGN